MPLVLRLRTKSHKKANKDLKVFSISFLLQTLLNRNSSAALKDGSFLACYFVKRTSKHLLRERMLAGNTIGVNTKFKLFSACFMLK